jgi:hypothetical protein
MSSISSDNVYYSDNDIELLLISEEESEIDIELSNFIENSISDTNKSLSDYNVKDLTKDFILNSIPENDKKLEQDSSYRFWGAMGFGTGLLGSTMGAIILMVTLTGLAILTNPIGWIIGGVSLVLIGIGGLGYFLYSVSQRLSVEEKTTIQQETEKLSTLLNLLNDNKDFKKHLDSHWYEAPFTLDQLMDHAKPFLPQPT